MGPARGRRRGRHRPDPRQRPDDGLLRRDLRAPRRRDPAGRDPDRRRSPGSSTDETAFAGYGLFGCWSIAPDERTALLVVASIAGETAAAGLAAVRELYAGVETRDSSGAVTTPTAATPAGTPTGDDAWGYFADDVPLLIDLVGGVTAPEAAGDGDPRHGGRSGDSTDDHYVSPTHGYELGCDADVTPGLIERRQ